MAVFERSMRKEEECIVRIDPVTLCAWPNHTDRLTWSSRFVHVEFTITSGPPWTSGFIGSVAQTLAHVVMVSEYVDQYNSLLVIAAHDPNLQWHVYTKADARVRDQISRFVIPSDNRYVRGNDESEYYAFRCADTSAKIRHLLLKLDYFRHLLRTD